MREERSVVGVLPQRVERGGGAIRELFEAVTPIDGSMGDSHEAAMLAPHAWWEIVAIAEEFEERAEGHRAVLDESERQYGGPNGYAAHYHAAQTYDLAANFVRSLLASPTSKSGGAG